MYKRNTTKILKTYFVKKGFKSKENLLKYAEVCCTNAKHSVTAYSKKETDNTYTLILKKPIMWYE